MKKTPEIAEKLRSLHREVLDLHSEDLDLHSEVTEVLDLHSEVSEVLDRDGLPSQAELLEIDRKFDVANAALRSLKLKILSDTTTS